MLKYFTKLRKNKKGSIQDVIFGGSYMLKISITIIICVFVWLSFKELMATAIVGSVNEGVITSVMNSLSAAYFSMDYMIPFIIGGLLLVSTVFAYKTGSSIIMGIFSFIFWIIAIVMSVLFVNVYLSVTAQFPTIYAAFPIMDVIMSNLHFFTLGWLAIITLVMFRKDSKESSADPGSMDGRFYSAN